MKHTHTIAVAVGAAVVATTGALIIDAALDDRDRPTTAARVSAHSEPLDEAPDDRPAVAEIDISGPPVTTAAGGLSRIDIADLIDRPLRAALEDWTAVERRTADEPDDVNIAEWLDEHDAIADWLADHDADLLEWLVEQDALSDEEWWSFERRLLREVLDEIRDR